MDNTRERLAAAEVKVLPPIDDGTGSKGTGSRQGVAMRRSGVGMGNRTNVGCRSSWEDAGGLPGDSAPGFGLPRTPNPASRTRKRGLSRIRRGNLRQHRGGAAGTPCSEMPRRERVPRWDRPDLPRKGWSNVDVEDMEEPCFECEFCRYPEVRFVHVMTHPEYRGALRVGCVCAGHLEENYAAARDRERRARNTATRRDYMRRRYDRALALWDLDWDVTPKGNLFRRSRHLNLTVFPDPRRPGRWKAVIGERFGTISYPTRDDAVRGIFRRLFPWERLVRDFEAHGRSTLKLPGERGFR